MQRVHWIKVLFLGGCIAAGIGLLGGKGAFLGLLAGGLGCTAIDGMRWAFGIRLDSQDREERLFAKIALIGGSVLLLLVLWGYPLEIRCQCFQPECHAQTTWGPFGYLMTLRYSAGNPGHSGWSVDPLALAANLALTAGIGWFAVRKLRR